MSFPSFAEWADVLQIRDELAWGQLWAQYPMYPLHSEGLALPGPDFDREAQLCGDTAPELSGTGSKKQLDNYGANLTYLHLQALYDPDFMLYCDFRGSAIPTPFVGGHILGDSPHGPVRSRVMIIGKHPKAEEVQQGLNFVCPSASAFWRALDDLRIPVEEYAQWYVTNLVRHNKIDPASNKVTPASVKNCLPLLQQELRLVRPEFILCFGTEAAKALLGNGHSVSDMFGRAIDFKIPINLPWEEPQYHTAKLMVCLDPAAVHHSPFKYDEYRDSFELFWRLTEGDKIGEIELDIDHREFDDEASLAAFVDELIAEGQTDFAIDAEWHKDAPQEEGAYLRTIQVSGKAKQAFLVNLRDAGGRVTFQPSLKAALPHLQRLLKRTPERFTTVGGHFLRADMPWLLHYGLDVRAEYAPAETWELQAAGKGGWDTALMLHGVMETGPFGLEYATSRLCGIPRYDIPLEKWKRQYCLENKLEPEQLDGYGMCPRAVLNPYACLHGESLVQLGDGSWRKISELVRDKYDGDVKAFLNGRVVNAKVTNWHRHAVKQKEWFQLRTTSDKQSRFGLAGPTFTPDHKVLTRRGKVAVEHLVAGQDAILTDESEFSSDQLSVFLAGLIGDGGFIRQKCKTVGFGFSQRKAVEGYVHWKAEVFATHNPALRTGKQAMTQPRYELPFSRYLLHLSQRFPVHPLTIHGKHKAIITEDLLNNLGDRGLAVWYQDDGTLVTDKRYGYQNSRIYATLKTEIEKQLVLDWLTKKLGVGVTYNEHSRFIQITGQAFTALHALINQFMHPAMAYKTPLPVIAPPRAVSYKAKPFYETILEVVPRDFDTTRRGHGVRYCLTVDGAGNFLTKVGFVSNCYDADGTKRVKERATELLNQDAFGLNSWKAFWQAHRGSLGFLEMELWGVPVDQKQADLLTDEYVQAADTKLEEFRTAIDWNHPTDPKARFNPNSVYQVREFLFGEALNDKRDKITGESVRLRPDNAMCLGITPVKTTGKPSRDWFKIVERGEEALYRPSTDRESLGILLHQYPGEVGDKIFALRDIKYLQQALRQVLRRPLRDETGELLVDDEGYHVYEKALVSWRWRDGRIHTHLSQNKETGRASSYRPPLQNISKRREDDYKRIFGDKYRAPLRSILCASPGMFLVEVDIKSAELAVLAWMSGDPQFIEDVRRNMLPEDHPDYLDLHADRAVSAFQLDCAPTKKGLESIDKVGLRVAAKNVNFGVPYGRAADAIARQCREEGRIVAISEAQALIDAYHERYPVASAFLAECRERSRSPGWLCGAYGRYRRFFATDDAKIIGEQERQACNFPIQNGVADYISEVIWQLMDYRAANGSKFRLVMQIHDALLFEVSAEHLPELVNTIIPECMTRRVPFRPCHLDGTPQDVAPYYFGVDVEVYRNWGVKVKKDELAKFGVAV